MIVRVISYTIVPRRRVASAAVAMLLATAMGGCKTTSVDDATSSYAMAPSQSTADGNATAALWAERYRANPKDPVAAINHANILRAGGQRAQAVAVLEQSSIHNPKSIDILGAYGRALAEVGNFEQALDVLNRAHSPDRPDWRLLSVQGAVLDQIGRHEEAQRYYATALRIVPDEPSVLSNLGLSYALSKDLVRAELTLRRAIARPGADQRVRQNLALVVGLQGRFSEAEAIAKADLPPETAAANMSYLRQMLAQQNKLPVQAAKGGRGS
ncbi:MAG TPA: tetratricopeptide repeat protein [Xanthobacteraceae bacterium]|nr:tetratricopeptide repeat protein [Xanthobacteraceae bacterium]